MVIFFEVHILVISFWMFFVSCECQNKCTTQNLSVILYVVYLTTLSVAQTTQNRKEGLLMNDESERIQKEAVVA
jgi:hypothetical protein